MAVDSHVVAYDRCHQDGAGQLWDRSFHYGSQAVVTP